MFCRRPFEQFYVDEEGDAHLCCKDWIAMPAGNIFARNPVEIWTGKVARNIRRSMLDGSLRHCINCPFLPGPAGCVSDDEPRELPTDRIDTLTIAYDPVCNLACPSCRLTSKNSPEIANRIQDILVNSSVFKMVNILCSSGSGDPLASPLYWKLLSALPPEEYPDLRLSLQTNGILLDERAWKRFGDYAGRIRSILVSIDAATPEAYFVNRGARFERLMENLEEVRRRGIETQLNFVVQHNNFREMLPFVELADRLGAQRIYFSALENWGTYTDEDYLERAVHLPGHRDHGELVEILGNKSFDQPGRVTLAGLPRPKP